MTEIKYPKRCPYCRQRLELDILEIWDHDFQLSTCCEQAYEEAIEWLNDDDPEVARQFARDLGIEDYTGHELRRLADDGHMYLDYNLDIREVPQGEAKDFVREYHRHCSKPPAGWRYGAAVWNGPSMIGVAMVGRPVARKIDHREVVEVNRLCIRTDVARALTWNACSKLYGWAAREARKRGFRRIITYTLRDEPGTTLVAAGWTCEGEAGGGSWNRPSRRRNSTGPTQRKVRWSRQLAA